MTQVYASRRSRYSLLSMVAGTVAMGITAAGCTALNGDPATKSYEEQLAEHLTAQNAVMYGAFWCPYCEEQKELFGRAVKDLPYVECDPEGENAQPQLCRDKDIAGYPTWEINGEFYQGAQSLEELARLSGFEEP